MKTADRLLQVLVELTAIREPRHYVVKPLFFLFVLSVMIYTTENTLIPAEQRKTLIELVPIILPGWVFLSLFVFTTITYLDKLQRQMAQLARTDDLTRLPNRRAFLESVSQQISAGGLGFLMILDLDHFKQVNDRYGHAAGDICLQLFAQRLRDTARPDDHFGRLGGEEFGFFFAEPDPQHLALIGDQLLETIPADLSHLGVGEPISISASIGAVSVARSQPLERLMHRADLALYQAKANGRAQMVVWSADMQTQIQQEAKGS